MPLTDPEQRRLEEIEVHTPLNWPFWQIETYWRFTDTLERFGPTKTRKVAQWHNREPMIARLDVIEGTQIGGTFISGCRWE